MDPATSPPLDSLLHSAALSVRDGTLVLPGTLAADKRGGLGPALLRTSPATGKSLFDAHSAADDQVDDVVTEAAAAFLRGGWGTATGRERAEVITRTADILSDESPTLARTIVLETGKPIREAEGEVRTAIDTFRFCAGLARDLSGRTLRDIGGTVMCFTLREPCGVAAAIVPWNFPLAILAQKVPAALAAGCTCVIKPSPLAPMSSLAVAVAFRRAGGPAGVVSVVLGGAETGARLVSHPKVSVISFTGSTAVGKDIAGRAHVNRFKRLIIEAGGKNAAIVLRDADLDLAVEGCLAGAFINQGEVCAATSKVLVERSIAEEFTHRLAARADALRVGDPFDLETEMGPVISREHHNGVLRMLNEGISTGARRRSHREPEAAWVAPGGPYLAPQVLDCIPDSSPLRTSEVFGPLTVVQTVDSLEEAVEECNLSEYGLGASLWTRDLQHALHGALQIQVGTVWVNGALSAFAELPFGGRRDSGFSRELGREGVEAFTELKTVQIADASKQTWYPLTESIAP
jgi:betaine-aldehyde dehydrogenase